MKNTLIQNAVEAAGGRSNVAKQLGITREAIRKWSFRGLPKNQWAPNANYLSQIETLQIKRHGKVLVSAEQIKAAQIWE